MVEKSLVKDDVASLLANNNLQQNTVTNRNSNQASNNAYTNNGRQNGTTTILNHNKPRQIMDDDQLEKTRKTRSRRRRPPKSEKRANADNNNFNLESQLYNQAINNKQKLQNSTNFSITNTQPPASYSSMPLKREMPKSHSLSLSEHGPSTNTPHDSTSSSSRSIDRNSALTSTDKFVHTVCGGFSKDTFHKRKVYKIKDDEQYSTSLPSSMGDNQPNMILNENRLPSNHQTQDARDGIYKQKRPTLMPTEPLMSINVNLGNTDISNPSIFNDYPSIINTNPKYDQIQPQQQRNSSNKMSEQMHRQETEFEKNYVFRMKKQLKSNEQAKYQCEICNYFCNSVDIVNKHISGPIHKNNLETMRLELKIRELELPSEFRLKQLTSYLVDFYNKNIISDQQLKYRYDVFYEFKRKFLLKYPTAKVNMYGSIAYGVCSNDSSVDIDIDYENHSKSTSQILKDAAELIRTEMADTFDPQQIAKLFGNTGGKKANKEQQQQCSNKISLLARFRNASQKIYFNFTNGLYATAYKTSYLIKAYFELDERVKILAFCFKYIAKIAQIDRVDLCTLPPHAYILMVIFYLQKLKPPILPCLHEIINSKKAHGARSTKTSISVSSNSNQNNATYPKEPIDDDEYFDDSITDEDSGDEEKDSIENFDVFKKNLQVYLKSQTWSISNTEDLGSLWLQLLAFYSIDFGFRKNFISIRSLTRVSKSEVKMYTKKMAIEDPFLLKQSLSRNLMTQTNKHIIYVISKACLYFVNTTRNLKGSDKDSNKTQKIVDKLIFDTGIHEAMKRNKEMFEQNENFEDNEQPGLFDEELLNEDEIDEDIFMLEDAYDDGTFSSLTEIDSYEGEEGRKAKLKKPSSTGRKSRQSETDASSAKDKAVAASLEKQLCKDIDQKLSLISAIDSALDVISASSQLGINEQCLDLNTWTTAELTNETELAVKMCLGDMTDKVVAFYDSIYDEMPHIALENFSNLPVIHKIESFKVTLNSLNLPKCPPKMCSMCNKEGHLERECPQDFLPELEKLPELTGNWTHILDSICKHILVENQQSKKEESDRNSLLERIKKIVKKKFPEAKLSLFGSSNNGFGMKKSDLDICMTLDNCSSAGTHTEKSILKKIIRILGALFRRESDFDMVEERINAKVPIVKFRHMKTDIEGDISLYNTLALQNTDLLRSYAEIDERTKVLGHVVKYFAKICRIGDASCGSLSSYAYIIMVIHYLMNTSPPVLPCLQKLNKENFSKKETNLSIDGWDCWFNKDLKSLAEVWPHYKTNTQSIGELWLGFLRYYTEVFDWDEHVVCIKDTDSLTRQSKSWTKHRLAIEDPFDLTHNLAAGVSHKMGLYILKSFTKARFLFGNVIHDFRPEEIRLNMEYFFNPKSLVDGILPMGRNCFTCLKIGHLTKDCPIANNNRKEKNQHRRIYSESYEYESNSLSAIVCYRCRKTGHMARDCQEHQTNDKRQKQSNSANTNTNSLINLNNAQKLMMNNYSSDRCFTCNGFGHLSRDCKSTVIFTSKNTGQQAQYNRQIAGQSISLNHQQQQHQQSAPMPKIIRIDHIPQARIVNPPILLQSGEEKYHIVVNKSGANSMMNTSDQSNKTKMETQHNVLANYQNFFQSQQQNYHIVQHNNQQHQQSNRQSSHSKGANNNCNVNGASVNSHNTKANI